MTANPKKTSFGYPGIYNATDLSLNDGDGSALAVNSKGQLVVAEQGGVSDAIEGGPVTIGTTAVELTFTGTTNSIFVQADHSNAGTIYFGKSDVTNAGAYALCRLDPGESITVDYDDADAALYAVATVASQKIYKMGLA